MPQVSQSLEWLEADGLGGFASGTTQRIRTRRYHALLLSAARPPGERFVLVNGFDAELKTQSGTYALSSQRYAPDVTHPDGHRFIERFEADPWPRWTMRTDDGTRVIEEVFAVKGAPVTCVSWRLADAAPSGAILTVRPFLSGRDYHALHHENAVFRFDPKVTGPMLRFSVYDGVPDILFFTNGQYRHEPEWYRRFIYEEERNRGLDHLEDLASPGTLRFDLSRGEAILILQSDRTRTHQPALAGSPERMIESYRTSERTRRQRFESKLHRAADAYVVSRGGGKTIVAGYPWFTDWGRDTFISVRGLCLATGRFEDARGILREWARLVSKGMLPNRFPDVGEPEYNSVDASLWFVIAAHDLLRMLKERRLTPEAGDLRLFNQAITDIVGGYAAGTRFGIRLDSDGLIACGEPGLQLTWMDAKIGDWVVTPRIGKPVEIQALWLNALKIAEQFSDRFSDLLAKGAASFERRFWDEAGGYLYDVVDADHEKGKIDRAFRPNQIFAVGGLPFPMISGRRALRIVENVEKKLWTPAGLRTLAREGEGYRAQYKGGPRERDAAYHNGTAWPYLLGPFVEAWVRANGMNGEAKAIARERFLQPLLARLETSGVGHLFEIADGDAPHPPRGCPFQAWSVGEALRLAYDVLRG